MNFCQEFNVNFNKLSPAQLFAKLNTYTGSPFASFYKVNNKYCLCSSPERYIRNKNNKVISQPIKGTESRGNTIESDKKNKKKLINSQKDFSENVMIADLVRNDLSITAKKNTVKVEELAKLYSYKNVHHLISTISSKINSNFHPLDVIKHSFPMGSMTGAPKLKSMELIEKYENVKRGLYSGSIGYFTPELDFDFNVVIRSLLYNQKSNYLSFIVGGAITIESDPNNEYEECLTKAKSILNVLEDEK
jgi:para-aminobenzoate synthetase component 1